jgi:hypothetical protein
VAGGRRLEALAERLPRDRETLRVQANLSVDVAGTSLAVSSRDSRVRIHVPSVPACIPLLRSGSGRLAPLAPVLAQAGVTAELRTGGAVLAVIGAEADPGLAAAALSLEAVEIRAGGLIAGLLRIR